MRFEKAATSEGEGAATRQTKARGSKRRFPIRRMMWRIVFIAAALPIVVALIYRFVPPVSTLMIGRWIAMAGVDRQWVPLEAISTELVRAVIAAEDARFCSHGGVDWVALNDVLDDAGDEGPARGASTITMQTVKNVFLWPGRSYIRKGLEIPLSLMADVVWGKPRTMEIYLNVAEWGEGIFGAEAAAQRAFGKTAKQLSRREAALLAAALPNPLRRDARRPSRYMAVYAGRIGARMPSATISCTGA
ncbi:monofunctional biosynthetic peptidoglycan transglycosylase [Chelatococcus asaccharovorans]|uniref:Biosynthetic peptidoglycan transglycosylase n=2 Tax=Chelatococcus asaccharovorans TaxID=28210 RepID=A0A2V3UHU6_9HYPH|nr:monofunctional biosynthetic peptidoglycan transglycosylase [Chelatococcus asaccharovorans]